ncbi:MAG: glycosyltransferase family 9 protein [Candidatus Woesearchaeota archaeon]
MNIGFIKFADKYLGTLSCYLLAPFKRKMSVSKKSILFVQLWGIGETILTLPAIKAAKARFPKAHLAVLATERNKAVYEGAPFIDELIILNLGFSSVIRSIFRFYKRFDVVIDMEEYLNVSAILSFFLGKSSIGYANQARSRLYDTAIPYRDDQHVALTYFDLVRSLGVSSKVTHLEKVNLPARKKQYAKRLLNSHGVQPKDFLVGFGIGSAESSQCRKWPKDNFAALADLLVAQYSAKVVFVGAKSEIPEVSETISLMEHSSSAINLAGTTDVPQLFALIESINLFVGNDSGPMHIAACQGVPAIGLFGPNLPARFGPFGKNNGAVYKGKVCRFSPCINVHLGQVPDCLYKKGSREYQLCMNAIKVKDVHDKIKEVLGR